MTQVKIRSSLPNPATKHLIRALELGLDPIGLTGEACIPPPRHELQAILRTG